MRENKYRTNAEFSLTDWFLICGFGVVTFILGHNIGYDKGLRDGQEIRKNSAPSAVITRSAQYFDQNGNLITEEKKALVIPKYGEVNSDLDKDETLSRSNLEVFVSTSIKKEERKVLVDYLEKFKE